MQHHAELSRAAGKQHLLWPIPWAASESRERPNFIAPRRLVLSPAWLAPCATSSPATASRCGLALQPEAGKTPAGF